MMQMNEIQRCYSSARRAIDHAAQVCQSEPRAPQELKECVQQMDQRIGQAEQIMQTQDEMRIRECIDDLEQLSDRAGRAVEMAGPVDDELREAVMEAHHELSRFKHQLH